MKVKSPCLKKLFICGVALIILAIVIAWWVGPRRISRIVPDEAISCQVLCLDISDLSAENISESVTLRGEDVDSLLDFLDQYDLSPMWDFSPNTDGSQHYTLLFYGETTLQAQVDISSEGIVKLGNRKYKFAHWTSDDADELHELLMIHKQ